MVGANWVRGPGSFHILPNLLILSQQWWKDDADFYSRQNLVDNSVGEEQRIYFSPCIIFVLIYILIYRDELPHQETRQCNFRAILEQRNHLEIQDWLFYVTKIQS